MQSISRKEAVLFVKSNTSKRYEWLISAITENHKFPHLSNKDFKKSRTSKIFTIKMERIIWIGTR